MAAWNELPSALSRYTDGIEADPARLQQLEERFNLLQSLKRKYGATLAEVVAFGEEAAKETATPRTARRRSWRGSTGELEKLASEIWQGRNFAAQRRKAIPRLVKAAMKHLHGLGFQQSHFDISLQYSALRPCRLRPG